MKKLSLDQLEVESFASQPSEEELINVKGGTGWYCYVADKAIEVYQWATSDDGSSSSSRNDNYIEYKSGDDYIKVIYKDSASVVTPDSAYVIKGY